MESSASVNGGRAMWRIRWPQAGVCRSDGVQWPGVRIVLARQPSRRRNESVGASLLATHRPRVASELAPAKSVNGPLKRLGAARESLLQSNRRRDIGPRIKIKRLVGRHRDEQTARKTRIQGRGRKVAAAPTRSHDAGERERIAAHHRRLTEQFPLGLKPRPQIPGATRRATARQLVRPARDPQLQLK